MIALMSALPNSILAQKPGNKIIIWGIEEFNVCCKLEQQGWVSAIGHDSTAKLFSNKLGLNIEVNRIQVDLFHMDMLVVGLFTPLYRLPEGQVWTTEEILAMPINWICVEQLQ